MNSQRELTPELIRAELALRYLYKFNPTNLSDCQKVIEEFSQGDTELIILPTTEDESFDRMKFLAKLQVASYNYGSPKLTL